MALMALAGAGAKSARASEDAPPAWNPEWPRFRPIEFALTGLLGPAAIAEYYLVRPQQNPRWIGGILFDDDVRSALRLRSPGGLKTVRFLADAVDVSLVVLAVGLDSGAVPLIRGNPDVAMQLSLMDAESFALSSLVAISLYDSVGRARPSYVDCEHGSTDDQCRTSPTASFPSGHVNEAFTAAGLSCAHHAHLSLYGSRLADALGCARDLTLAATDGLLRIMGDRHYLSDVLAGGAIGFAFGYGLPTLFHYTGPGRGPISGVSFAPMTGNRLGLLAIGSF
jgi:membrane-associated phospholipid phosphatase